MRLGRRCSVAVGGACSDSLLARASVPGRKIEEKGHLLPTVAQHHVSAIGAHSHRPLNLATALHLVFDEFLSVFVRAKVAPKGKCGRCCTSVGARRSSESVTRRR